MARETAGLRGLLGALEDDPSALRLAREGGHAFVLWVALPKEGTYSSSRLAVLRRS